jgi:hypothetical protein
VSHRLSAVKKEKPLKPNTLPKVRIRARSASVAALLPVAALTLALAGCADDEVRPADAQNPMGDSATAAVADSDGPPAAANGDGGVSAPRAYAFGSSAAESAQCMDDLRQRLSTAAAAQKADSATKSPGAGRNPAYAERYGWYPDMPEFMDGSILPCSRIVAYYGHPSSTRMGALGEFPKEEMLRRFKAQVAEWEKADPSTPVVPALHMVSVVAQSEPGTAGKYRTITSDEKVSEVYGWAKEAGAIFIVDIQVGQDDIRNILPRFDWILKNPDVHLAVDPEFYMRGGVKPGAKIGTMDASDINYVTEHLAKLVREHNLPPKVLIIHRFTRPMVTNYKQIKLRPEVNFVLHMDGWGAPWLKYDSYQDYVVQEPIQFTGWKNFYHNDTKKGDPLVTPAELVKLFPAPLYIQYQ